MAGSQDPTEFMDTDFTAQKSPYGAPTREDVDRKVVEAQQKLVELKRAQEELERQRAGLEELRRRQTEFTTGREEMIQQLTRGLGLLEEAEFATRRDAEQMVKTIADFRQALDKVQGIREDLWTQDSFQQELTRALTTIENARMEWNAARVKLPVLAGEQRTTSVESKAVGAGPAAWADLSFGQMCKLGLAFTWPLLLVALAAWGIFFVILTRK